MRPPRANPFRVDRVTTLPYVGDNTGELAKQSLIFGRAAIVGPHGAGKSTLLRAVGDELIARGACVVHVTLPGSADAAARRRGIDAGVSAGDAVLLIDGYEQFTPWQSLRLRRVGRMLVTAHRPSRLPTLAALRPTPATLDALLDRLLPTVSPATRDVAHAAFARHGGDVRETMMTLYDAWADGTIEDGRAASD